jgi:hypothetical protein
MVRPHRHDHLPGLFVFSVAYRRRPPARRTAWKHVNIQWRYVLVRPKKTVVPALGVGRLPWGLSDMPGRGGQSATVVGRGEHRTPVSPGTGSPVLDFRRRWGTKPGPSSGFWVWYDLLCPVTSWVLSRRGTHPPVFLEKFWPVSARSPCSSTYGSVSRRRAIFRAL